MNAVQDINVWNVSVAIYRYISKKNINKSLVWTKKEENFLENLFSDKANFRKRLYDFWNFTISQEKRIIKIYKKLVEFDSMPAETKRDLKPVGTTPGIMYDSY